MGAEMVEMSIFFFFPLDLSFLGVDVGLDLEDLASTSEGRRGMSMRMGEGLEVTHWIGWRRGCCTFSTSRSRLSPLRIRSLSCIRPLGRSGRKGGLGSR